MKKNNKKGFTLVELVIVVAVMAVLVAVAIPTVGSIKKSAEDSVAKSNAKTIESIIKLADAKADGTGTVSEENIAKALAEAKLGIASGKKFAYNSLTGAVTVGDAAAGSVQITFGDNGSVVVKKDSTTKTATVQADGSIKVE